MLDVNYKTGRKKSAAAGENLQLRTEVVLLFDRYRETVQRIGATIVEPLATKRPEIVVYGPKELLKAEVEILEIVDRTHWVAKRTAGDWCWHCPARAFCPEAKALALGNPLYVMPEPLPVGQDGAEMIGKIEVAYRVLDALWEAYKKRVRDGEIPGWWISEGDKIRYLPDDNRLEFQKRIQENELSGGIRGSTTFHLAKFEAYCGEAWALKGRALKDKFEEIFGDLIAFKRKSGSMERIHEKYAHLKNEP